MSKGIITIFFSITAVYHSLVNMLTKGCIGRKRLNLQTLLRRLRSQMKVVAMTSSRIFVSPSRMGTIALFADLMIKPILCIPNTSKACLTWTRIEDSVDFSKTLKSH